jgi:hypothetical protein
MVMMVGEVMMRLTIMVIMTAAAGGPFMGMLVISG